MTEIQQYQQPTAAAPSTIQQTALELSGAMQIANAICQSTFVPQHFRGKPEECAVAMLYGATIGFDPVTSVQQIYVIGGKPALYARAMVAIVLAAGHEIWVEDEKPGMVTVAGKRKGSDKVQRVTWTSQMAETAGYTKNAKYRTDPQSMLYARASGDLARRLAPDALMGMAYNVEEMQLVPAEQQHPATDHATPQTQKDRVRAAIATKTTGPADAGGQPAPEQPPAAPAAGPADTPLITAAQSKKLHTLVGKLGLDRDAKINGVRSVIGRPINSTSELTKAEANQVIESLQARVDMTDAGEEPVDGVIVVTLDDVIAEGQRLGMDMWQIEAAFDSDHDAKLPEADPETLAGFLDSLRDRAGA